jgi:hypothetical protein
VSASADAPSAPILRSARLMFVIDSRRVWKVQLWRSVDDPLPRTRRRRRHSRRD